MRLFFHQRVRGFAYHQCKFLFDSMHGGLDTPYGSNDMKIDKEGCLNHLKTIDDHLGASTIYFLSIGMVANE